MPDESAETDAVTADADALDAALAAFEDACAQVTVAAETAARNPGGRAHLAAVRARLAAVSLPVTTSTADALLAFAADARAALQRVLAGDDDPDVRPEADLDDGIDDEVDDGTGDDAEAESAEPDPVLDLAPEPDPEPVETTPVPRGYRALTSLPTRNVPHVLVFEGGRWQRAAIAFTDDDTLVVRLSTARTGRGRRLDDYAPAHIARPHARA